MHTQPIIEFGGAAEPSGYRFHGHLEVIWTQCTDALSLSGERSRARVRELRYSAEKALPRAGKAIGVEAGSVQIHVDTTRGAFTWLASWQTGLRKISKPSTTAWASASSVTAGAGCPGAIDLVVG